MFMKNIDITSDLHTDFIYKWFKDIYWTNWVLTQTWKYLIIAGDINEDIYVLQRSFDDIIKNANYKKIIVTFWNHDLRFNLSDEDFNINDSIEKYEFLINHFHKSRFVLTCNTSPQKAKIKKPAPPGIIPSDTG